MLQANNGLIWKYTYTAETETEDNKHFSTCLNFTALHQKKQNNKGPHTHKTTFYKNRNERDRRRDVKYETEYPTFSCF